MLAFRDNPSDESWIKTDGEKMKHLLDITDMSVSEIDALVNQAENIMKTERLTPMLLTAKRLPRCF